MTKQVWKLIPVGLNNIPALELWFEDMAAQGLYLKDCLEWHAVFTPGPPAQVRYRLEPVDKFQYDPRPTQEQKELYAKSGWQYVATVWRFYYAFLSTDPQVPELHTDPVTQSYALDRLVRRRFWGFLGITILYLIIFCSRLYVFAFAPFWYVALESNLGLLILFALLCLWWPLFHFWRFWGLFQLRRQLRRGIPLQRRRTAPWLRRVFLALLGLELALLLFAGCLRHNTWTKGGDLSALVDFPLLTLQQVEQNPELQLIPMQEHRFEATDELLFTSGSYVEYHWSDLAPQVYSIHQQASGSPSSKLSIYYCHLRFSFISVPVAYDLMELGSFYQDWTPLSLSHPSADLILAAEQSGHWRVCAVRGSRVVLAEYSGTAAPQDCLDGIAAMISGQLP